MARVIETRFDGPVLIEPDVFGDDRGFFLETFSRDGWRELGVDEEFIQTTLVQAKAYCGECTFRLRPDKPNWCVVPVGKSLM